MTQQPAETADRTHAPEPGGESVDGESLGHVFHRLYADGRAYAQAEAERQKKRATLIGLGVRDAVILGAIALMLLFAALVALLIGLVILLAPVLGALGALGAVVGGALLVVLLLLLLAKARIGRMKKAIAP